MTAGAQIYPHAAPRGAHGGLGWLSRVFARNGAAGRLPRTVLSFAIFLALWQVAAGRWVSPYFVSNPLAVAHQVAEWFSSGYLWVNLGATLATTGIGFAAAAVTGISAALLFGSVPILDRIFGPLIYLAYALPKVVLAPLLILWFGIGWLPPVLLAFITGFFMVFFNAYSGFRAIDPKLLNSVRLMGATPWALATKVRLPMALPYITTAFHQGLVYAFHGTILGEMTGSDRGMGFVILFSAQEMDANGVIAALAIIGAITLTLTYAISRLLGLAVPKEPAP